MHDEKRKNIQEKKRMTTNGGSRFVYVLVGLALGAVGGLMAALLIDKQPRELRERVGKSLDYLKRQAGKLRQSAEVLLQEGKKLIPCKPSDSVVHSTEAEKQAYQEDRRENLGG
jgi:gas vesicle protein